MKQSKRSQAAPTVNVVDVEVGAARNAVQASMIRFAIEGAHAVSEAATLADGSLVIAPARARRLRGCYEVWRVDGNKLVELVRSDPAFVVDALAEADGGPTVGFIVSERPSK